jgi:hypothetical protein
MKAIPSTAATRTLAMDARDVSLKRAAWAYGCAKKGSEEERLLLELLLGRAELELRQRAGCCCAAVDIEGHHPSCRYPEQLGELRAASGGSKR